MVQPDTDPANRATPHRSGGGGAPNAGLPRVLSSINDEIRTMEGELNSRLSPIVGTVFISLISKCGSLNAAQGVLKLFRELLQPLPAEHSRYAQDISAILEKSARYSQAPALTLLVSGIIEVLTLNPNPQLWAGFVRIADEIISLGLRSDVAVSGYCKIVERSPRLPHIDSVIGCYLEVLPFVRDQSLVAFAESAEKALALLPETSTVQALRCTWGSIRTPHTPSKKYRRARSDEASEDGSRQSLPGSVQALLAVLKVEEFHPILASLVQQAHSSLSTSSPTTPTRPSPKPSIDPLLGIKILALAAGLHAGQEAYRAIAEAHRASKEEGAPFAWEKVQELAIQNATALTKAPEARALFIAWIDRLQAHEKGQISRVAKVFFRLIEESPSLDLVKQIFESGKAFSGAYFGEFIEAIRGCRRAFRGTPYSKHASLDELLILYLAKGERVNTIRRDVDRIIESKIPAEAIGSLLQTSVRFLPFTDRLSTIIDKRKHFRDLYDFALRFPNGGAHLANILSRRFSGEPTFGSLIRDVVSITITAPVTPNRLSSWAEHAERLKRLDFQRFIGEEVACLIYGYTLGRALAKCDKSDREAAQRAIDEHPRGPRRAALAHTLTTLLEKKNSVTSFLTFSKQLLSYAPNDRQGDGHVLLAVRGTENLPREALVILSTSEVQLRDCAPDLFRLGSLSKKITPVEWAYLGDSLIYAVLHNFPLSPVLKDFMIGVNGRESFHKEHEVVDNLATLEAIASSGDASYLKNAYRGDSLPTTRLNGEGKRNPEEIAMRIGTNSVFRRALDPAHGFRPALQRHAIRGSGNSPSLLAQFGGDVAHSCKILNANRVDGFPGRSFYFQGINLERTFGHDKRAVEEGYDPLQAYKVALPWGAEEIEPLQHTHFILGRGCLIVFSDKQEHVLDGTEYAYVVWFADYINLRSELAWLVPKKIILEKIKGSQIDYLDYTGPRSGFTDINQRDLTPEGLERAAQRLGLSILKLDPSAFSGGLCNAYPPRSSPHFLEAKDFWAHRDGKGHPNKSFLGGNGGSSTGSSALMREYHRYQELHYAVDKVITSLQDRLDLGIRLPLSLWNRNLTGSQSLVDFGEELDGPLLLKKTGFVPQAQARMLQWAYREHLQRKTNPLKMQDDYGIVRLCRTFEYRGIQPSPFEIDTFNLVLTIFSDGGAREQYQLPPDSDGNGEKELALWNQFVSPHFYHPTGELLLDVDIRPCQRFSV